MSLRHFLKYPGGRVELPKHRAFVWHVFDTEPWRKRSCEQCGRPFTEEPRQSFISYDFDTLDCMIAYIDEWYRQHPDGAE
jgi:hypothetical protein